MLLMFASHQIEGVYRVLNALHLYSDDAGMVTIGDLGMISSILLILSTVTGRKIPLPPVCHEVAAWGICVIPVLGMIWTGRFFTHYNWINGFSSVLLAGAFLKVRSTSWLQPFAWFGGISYAFYLLHFPLAYFGSVLAVSQGYSLSVFSCVFQSG